jgi:hypothetical protein
MSGQTGRPAGETAADMIRSKQRPEHGGTMRLRTESTTWQEIGGELIILDLAGSVYLTTNQAGAFLAKLLTDEHTEEELVAALIVEYEISRDVAAADTQAFLAQLRDKNLLVADER